MKRTSAATQRKYILIHESGHALLFWYYGFILYSVTVFADPETNFAGCVRCDCEQGGTTFIQPNTLSAARVHAMIAGRVATEVFLPEMPTGNVPSVDFENLEKLKPPDDETLRMLQWKAENPDATTDDFFQAFKKPVVRILKSKPARRGISALCKALEKAGTLSGAEAAAILSEAWGDPQPSLALPVERHMALTDKGPQNYEDLLRWLRAYSNAIQSDIRRLRDGCFTDAENDHLDRLWAQTVVFKHIL